MKEISIQDRVIEDPHTTFFLEWVHSRHKHMKNRGALCLEETGKDTGQFNSG